MCKIFIHSKSEIDSERCELLYISDAAKENLALLLRRAEDSKTNVRKSALQVPDRFMIQIQIMLSTISDQPLLFIFHPSFLRGMFAHMTFNLQAVPSLHRPW